MDYKDIAALVRKAQAGDKQSLNDICGKYYDAIKYYAQELKENTYNLTRMNLIINECLNENYDIIPERQETEQYGWTSDYKHFVPFTDEIDIIEKDEGKINAYTTAGSVDIWRDFMQKNRDRNEIFRLYTDAAMVTPLIGYVEDLAFVVNLFGESGSGKSTMLNVAASMWGNPGKIVTSFNNTENCMLDMAVRLHDITLFADEQQTMRSSNPQNLIYAITEGRERGRMTQSGESRKTRTFHTVTLCTGEKSINGQFTDGGAANRVIELQVSLNDPIITYCGGVNNQANSCESLDKKSSVMSLASQIINDNHGFAAKDFIEYIKKSDKDKILQLINDFSNQLNDAGNSTGKQSRAMAIIMTADTILNECGVFSDSQKIDAAACAKYLIKQSDIDKTTAAYEYVCNKICQYECNFVYDSKLPNDASHSANNINRCYGKRTANNHYCIIKNIMDGWLKEFGVNIKTVASKWIENGWLIPGSDSWHKYQQNLMVGDTRQWLYCIFIKND